GEVHGGLPGGVSSTDDKDVRAVQRASFRHRCTVENPGPCQCLQTTDADATVADAGRKDDGSSTRLLTVRSRHHMPRRVASEPDCLSHEQEVRSEHPRLLVSPLGEIGTADSAGKAEI